MYLLILVYFREASASGFPQVSDETQTLYSGRALNERCPMIFTEGSPSLPFLPQIPSLIQLNLGGLAENPRTRVMHLMFA